MFSGISGVEITTLAMNHGIVFISSGTVAMIDGIVAADHGIHGVTKVTDYWK